MIWIGRGCLMAENLKIKMYAFTLDCKEPSELSKFYAALLKWDIMIIDEDYACVYAPGTNQGTYPSILFQRNSEYTPPPVWPKEIFNAFVNGCGNLSGVTLQTTLCDKSKAVPEEVLRFWYHIVEVEDALKIKFDVGKDITLEDIKLVNALHRCFIEKKPFKEYINDST